MEIRTEEMLTESQKREMVQRIREYMKCYTHADFARKMGISPQNAYAWLQRGAFNAELVAIKCPDISGDWLLTGKGPMLKTEREKELTSTPRNNSIDKLVDALAKEQQLTAKTQEQSKRLIELMQSMTALCHKKLTEN